jgi:PAS domain S-box-containing protein
MSQESIIDQPRLLLAAIVDSSEDAIISKNLSGIITTWNEGAKRLFGYSEEEIVGKSVLTLIPPDLHKEEPSILAKLQRGERIEHFETVRVTKNGRSVQVSLTVSPIKDGEGRVIGASKIVRDITERKQIERALVDAQVQLQRHAVDLENRVEERTVMLRKMVDELQAFSYSLSHDLRAPLRAVQSYLQMLLEDNGEQIDASGKAIVQKVISSAQRMDRMILELLNFTRLSHETMTIEPVDVEKLIHGIIQERLELQPAHADITMASPLPKVLGNEASLTQCITNLLDNAVKFVAVGVRPEIRISSEKRDGTVRLSFRDNGIGIDADAQKQLFQMFQRVHGNSYAGTGIGLAIVRRAVERMGGSVEIESKPQQGSRFWIQLPEASP